MDIFLIWACGSVVPRWRVVSMFLFPHKKTRKEAAVNEQALLDRDPKLAKTLYHAYLENGECETQQKPNKWAFLKHPSKLTWSKEKYGVNTKNLPILGMQLHLASLIWFPSSNALYHSLSS